MPETMRAPPKSPGKVAPERIPGELSLSTYLGRYVAPDSFPERQAARESLKISLRIV
nr:hypothetical protein [Tanacetum cinerariifolium]